MLIVLLASTALHTFVLAKRASKQFAWCLGCFRFFQDMAYSCPAVLFPPTDLGYQAIAFWLGWLDHVSIV